MIQFKYKMDNIFAFRSYNGTDLGGYSTWKRAFGLLEMFYFFIWVLATCVTAIELHTNDYALFLNVCTPSKNYFVKEEKKCINLSISSVRMHLSY